MKTSDFDYSLPQELIAQTPAEPRDSSRLMVVSRSDGSIAHRRFHHLPEYLKAGDLLVFNDSRVIPARLYGRKKGSGGRVELLLLNRTEAGLWRCLVRPGRRMGPGTVFEVDGADNLIEGTVAAVEGDGSRLVSFSREDGLSQAGVVPLPPYIHRPLEDPERYQTVYSRLEGSVAAPTAGLHFTRELLGKLQEVGVEFAFVTLHIGWDTFKPVKEEDPREHAIHTEYWELNEEAASKVNAAKKEGRRIVAVGTTSVRLLEQAAALRLPGEAELRPFKGWADLFIMPGYRFQMVDAMVTNFHLPRSTLLMLVSAFASQDLVFRAYQEAIQQRYRFYSFGDSMVIV